MSSKRRPLKKSDKVHYSIAGFPHALLVWAYETFPSIASKFATKYDQAILRMLSWITVDNVKFNDAMWAFTVVVENQVIYLSKSCQLQIFGRHLYVDHAVIGQLHNNWVVITVMF